MKRLKEFLLAVLCVSISCLGFAQDPARPAQTPQQRDDQVPKIGTLQVRLPITVKKNNQFVEGLSERNFEVYEDGKKQKIESFIAPSQLPLYIGLLLDTSESVKLKLPFEKDAAEDFVSTVTTYRRKDKVLLASFDSKIELHQDFTDSQQKLIEKIRKLKAGGFTRMYEAVHRVIEEKMINVPQVDARRILVILSDGADTGYDVTLRQAIEMAQRYDVTIFGVSTKNFSGVTAGQVEGEDDKELRELCEQTGGQIFLPSQKAELFRAFTQVALDLRKEYVLFYTPTNQDKNGKRRKIEVKIVGADARLYHKKGYTY